MKTPGAGMGQVIDLALQEALVLGLHTLASDRRAIEELVGREDTLRNNTADAWKASLRAALVEMLDPGSDQYCDVLLGYPVGSGIARLPALSIVVDGGGENQGETVCGNLIREGYEFVGPNQELWATTELGAGQTSTLQIGAWSTAPERSALLIAAAQWALYQQQTRLLERGIHEISYRRGGQEVAPEMEPRVAWMPMLMVTLNWTFRESSRRLVPNRVRILRGTPST